MPRIKPVSFSHFRRSVCNLYRPPVRRPGTLSEDRGIGENMLQRLLRHSSPKTQRHYRHEDFVFMARAMAKIRY